MVKKGLLVRLQARHGKEAEVVQFLQEALSVVEQEPKTTAWFAVRLDLSTFGIVDAFPDEDGRQGHLAGRVAAELVARAPDLLVRAPVIDHIDILAAKLPLERPVAALDTTSL